MSQILFRIILFCFITAIYGKRNPYQADCQRHRARGLARSTSSQINLVPNCEPNGNYSALQCYTNSTWCHCWTSNGLPLNQPSTKIKRCDCILANELAQTTIKTGQTGVYEPQCAPNGGYNKKQCHANLCWCVNVETGAQMGEKVRGDLECK